MKCFHCGEQLEEGGICANCGADVQLYKKIIFASNAYYNEGLKKAEVRDLSGAIDSLKTSLRFYKMNTDARNLLGLVYFEMGERSTRRLRSIIRRCFTAGRTAEI